MTTNHTTRHDVEVDAPADQVYAALAHAADWPCLFAPTVHVEVLEKSKSMERLRIWATANDSVKSWTSRRDFDLAQRRIDFRQERSAAPVAAMGGSWQVESTAVGTCRVRLDHHFRAVDDDPAATQWIATAVERNSTSELASLAAFFAADDEESQFTIEDTIHIDADRDSVYEFLAAGAEWSRRLPHVVVSECRELGGGVQALRMDTRTRDGSTHSTESVRVCFPNERIVYKQTVLPALMSLHLGWWTVSDGPSGVRATAGHTVRIAAPKVTDVLGSAATVADARAFVTEALRGNSGATLRAARQFAEGSRI
ncbi:aromatase [Nocardia tenerifensis]|uniref:Aromatase n=1 Tax=Nocardia tenerifensis TaxID=228006 RepID=A0A318KHS0_9NOCA|nr:aromatase/cyclase [Nocardia tenerifensis]PXX71713.1 aromatase [Nocardia tenerifensis]